MNLKLCSPDAEFGALKKSDYFRPALRQLYDADSGLIQEAAAVCKFEKFKRAIVIGCADETMLCSELRQHVPALTLLLPAPDAPFFVAHESLGKLSEPELDLETWVGCSGLSELVASDEPTLIILDRVFERLWDLRPLLATLRRMLQRGPQNLCMLNQFDPAKAPVEPAIRGYREWTAERMQELIEGSGFERSELGNASTRCTAHSIRSSVKSYGAFLSAQELPPPSIRTFVVTSEHPDFSPCGGIGSYVGELERLVDPNVIGIVLCAVDLSRNANSSSSVIQPRTLFDPEALTEIPIQDVALTLVQQLLLYYPELECIEYQDFLGVGSRLVQAKESNLLPPDITLCAHCHGGHVYIESAERKWMNLEQTEFSVHERVSIERADRVIFPTQFLANLYREAGIKLPEGRIEFQRYPFVRAAKTEPKPLETIDTLVFFGKQNLMKGYAEFLEALLQLGDLSKLGVQQVIFLGTALYSDKLTEAALRQIQYYTRITYLSLSSAETLSFIDEQRTRCLWLLPYRSDNHPYSLLEMMLLRCAFVTFGAGGIPELVPDEFHAAALCPPNAKSLAAAISARLGEPVALRQIRADRMFEVVAAQYPAINNSVRERFTAGRLPRAQAGLRKTKNQKLSLSVIVPAFNAEANHLRDLAQGVRHQLFRPDELILIDDGSAPRVADTYEEALREAGTSVRIIRNPQNKGLAAARNLGLAAAQTDIVVNIDSDDVPLPRFLLDMHDYLIRRPETVAVSHYLRCFSDGSDWSVHTTKGYAYRPIGEGYVLGHLLNCFGSANTAFRTEELRRFGGWDESDKSMWEDWALYLRMVAAGHRIAMIPSIGCLYRVRQDSMQRSYPKFPAQKRLARALISETLEPYEALRLEGLLQHMMSLEKENQQFRAQAAQELFEEGGSVVKLPTPLERKTFAEGRSLLRITGPADCQQLEAGDQTELSSDEKCILVRSTGTDPQILLPELSVPPGVCALCRIELDYHSTHDRSYLQLFYKSEGVEFFSERESVTAPLIEGANTVFLELQSKAGIGGRLRLDPTNAPAQIALRSLEIRLLPL